MQHAETQDTTQELQDDFQFYLPRDTFNVGTMTGILNALIQDVMSSHGLLVKATHSQMDKWLWFLLRRVWVSDGIIKEILTKLLWSCISPTSQLSTSRLLNEECMMSKTSQKLTITQLPLKNNIIQQIMTVSTNCCEEIVANSLHSLVFGCSVTSKKHYMYN